MMRTPQEDSRAILFWKNSKVQTWNIKPGDASTSSTCFPPSTNLRTACDDNTHAQLCNTSSLVQFHYQLGKTVFVIPFTSINYYSQSSFNKVIDYTLQSIASKTLSTQCFSQGRLLTGSSTLCTIIWISYIPHPPKK